MAVSVPPSSASARSQAPSRKEGATRRFEDALRRHGAMSAESPGAERPARSPRAADRPLAAVARRTEERRTELASSAPVSQAGFAASPPTGVSELQAVVRAAPPAIAAAVAAGGQAQLALNFGPALSVDLRSGPQGLTLSLRPGPSLGRAARAELPRLVEALRARGLRVARAEVRGEMGVGAAQAPSRAR